MTTPAAPTPDELAAYPELGRPTDTLDELGGDPVSLVDDEPIEEPAS